MFLWFSCAIISFFWSICIFIVLYLKQNSSELFCCNVTTKVNLVQPYGKHNLIKQRHLRQYGERIIEKEKESIFLKNNLNSWKTFFPKQQKFNVCWNFDMILLLLTVIVSGK